MRTHAICLAILAILGCADGKAFAQIAVSQMLVREMAAPLVFVSQISGQSPDRDDTFALAASLQQSSIRKGAEAKLDIVLTNETDHEILVGFERGEEAGERSGFEIEVLDSRQHLAPRTAYGKFIRGEGDPIDMNSSASRITLAPGEHFNQTVILSKLFELSARNYTVYVRRWDNDARLYVYSNRVTLTVVK